MKWTPRQDERVKRALRKGHSNTKIGKAVGRSPGSISGRVDRKGWAHLRPAKKLAPHGQAATIARLKRKVARLEARLKKLERRA